MGDYLVHLNLAPSGGRSLAHGEVVSIPDEDLGPYETFIVRRWLTPVVPPGYVAPAAVADDEVEDAPIVDDDPVDEVPPEVPIEVPNAETEAPAE